MSSERQRGLGRGLGALIPTDVPRESLVGRPSDMFFDRNVPTAAVAGAHDTRRRPRPTPTSSAFNAETAAATKTASGSAFDKAFEGMSSRRAESGDDGLTAVPGVELAELELDLIRPNARQPRSVFDEEELSELAASIEEIGVLQPIVVRKVEDGPTPYELIMGERRWRATRQAGLDTIPAIVKSTNDDEMLRDALLENLHRAQLNPLEEAAAYQQLLDDFGCTHDVLATRLARSRPQISNTLRLLKLPPLVARRVAAGVLTAGHARALLGLPDAAAMERLAQRIVAEGLSVRSVEEIVAVATDESVPSPRKPRARAQHPEFDALAAVLTDRLDTRVSINMGRNKGKLTVEFAGREDLERILSAIRDSNEADLDRSLREAM